MKTILKSSIRYFSFGGGNMFPVFYFPSRDEQSISLQNPERREHNAKIFRTVNHLQLRSFISFWRSMSFRRSHYTVETYQHLSNTLYKSGRLAICRKVASSDIRLGVSSVDFSAGYITCSIVHFISLLGVSESWLDWDWKVEFLWRIAW